MQPGVKSTIYMHVLTINHPSTCVFPIPIPCIKQDGKAERRHTLSVRSQSWYFYFHGIPMYKAAPILPLLMIADFECMVMTMILTSWL